MIVSRLPKVREIPATAATISRERDSRSASIDPSNQEEEDEDRTKEKNNDVCSNHDNDVENNYSEGSQEEGVESESSYPNEEKHIHVLLYNRKRRLWGLTPLASPRRQ